jgi:hypothetical protein
VDVEYLLPRSGDGADPADRPETSWEGVNKVDQGNCRGSVYSVLPDSMIAVGGGSLLCCSDRSASVMRSRAK